MKEQNLPKKSVQKPKIATVYPSQDDKKKLTLMIPGVYIKEVAVFSHEKLSVLRQWATANGYSVDESRLTKPNKPNIEGNDEDLYTY